MIGKRWSLPHCNSPSTISLGCSADVASVHSNEVPQIGQHMISSSRSFMLFAPIPSHSHPSLWQTIFPWVGTLAAPEFGIHSKLRRNSKIRTEKSALQQGNLNVFTFERTPARVTEIPRLQRSSEATVNRRRRRNLPSRLASSIMFQLIQLLKRQIVADRVRGMAGRGYDEIGDLASLPLEPFRVGSLQHFGELMDRDTIRYRF